MDDTPNQEISNLISDLTTAWSIADAKGFAGRFQKDGTFTNIFGQTFERQVEFEKRHADVFTGIFKGTKFELGLLKLRYLRPDVALADLETRVLGITKKLPVAPQHLVRMNRDSRGGRDGLRRPRATPDHVRVFFASG